MLLWCLLGAECRLALAAVALGQGQDIDCAGSSLEGLLKVAREGDHLVGIAEEDPGVVGSKTGAVTGGAHVKVDDNGHVLGEAVLGVDEFFDDVFAFFEAALVWRGGSRRGWWRL